MSMTGAPITKLDHGSSSFAYWRLVLVTTWLSALILLLVTIMTPHHVPLAGLMDDWKIRHFVGGGGGGGGASLSSSLSGVLRVATFVDSHMVLQREPHYARIWGWAAPGANITVELTQENNSMELFHVTAKTHNPNNNINDGLDGWSSENGNDDDAFWMLEFPPHTAGDGYSLTIFEAENENETKIVLSDIAFGDVYFCSGQSNMQMSVSGVFDASKEIEYSSLYPNLRLAIVTETLADTPQTDVSSQNRTGLTTSWARSQPLSVGGPGMFSYFSATCYFFGRDLYQSFNGTVPIGLVASSWGGQKIETFSSPDALADDSCGGIRPGAAQVSQRPVRMMTDNNDGPQATQIWNAMIYPFLPMRLSGVIWYQGEANSGNATSYACRFPAMISDWRQKWRQPDFKFVYVELASTDGINSFVNLRAAQHAALQLPSVGFATAIDLADNATAPAGVIHPRRKQEVGRRVALAVLAMQYNHNEIVVSTGPLLHGVQSSSSTNSSSSMLVRLSFVVGTAEGLHFHDAPDCTECCEQAPPFETLSGSGTWTRVAKAETRHDSNDVNHDSREVLLLATGSQIFGIRYAWEARPECLLYNGQGGPDDHAGIAAAPFEWCAYPSGKGAWTDEGCQIGNAFLEKTDAGNLRGS